MNEKGKDSQVPNASEKKGMAITWLDYNFVRATGCVPQLPNKSFDVDAFSSFSPVLPFKPDVDGYGNEFDWFGSLTGVVIWLLELLEFSVGGWVVGSPPSVGGDLNFSQKARLWSISFSMSSCTWPVDSSLSWACCLDFLWPCFVLGLAACFVAVAFAFAFATVFAMAGITHTGVTVRT